MNKTPMSYPTRKIYDPHLPTLPALSICACPNGREILTSALDFQLRKWDLEEGVCIQTWNANGPLNAIQVVPSGKTALLAAVQGIVPWNLETWELCSTNTFWSFCWITDLAYSDATGEILGAGENYLIYRWNLMSGNQGKPLRGHRITVTTVCLDTEGRYALSGDLTGELRCWDLSTGICLKAWQGHDQKITSAAMSHEGFSAVTGSQDGRVRIWDLQTARCIMTLKEDDHWVERIFLCEDGRRILSGGTGGLYLWDFDNGELVARNDCARIVDFCLTPDEAMVIGIVKSNELFAWSIG